MGKYFDAIKQRISVRSYTEKKVETELIEELAEVTMKHSNAGPFGTKVRFNFINLEPLNRTELRSLGTYGMIRGAHLYILGVASDETGAMEDLGYCLEKIILHATLMGLGTCWLGGTFRRAAFASKMNLDENELLPAITPVGYPARAVSVTDRMIRFGAGSKRRKPWSEIFFRSDGITPLAESDAAGYKDAFEAVRIGPSASNKQPWRLIMDEAGRIQLYLKENKVYNRLMGKIRIQLIDMGIAMSHFELVAGEHGLPGSWVAAGNAPHISGLQHIATWS
jgi:nitroreductase